MIFIIVIFIILILMYLCNNYFINKYIENFKIEHFDLWTTDKQELTTLSDEQKKEVNDILNQNLAPLVRDNVAELLAANKTLITPQIETKTIVSPLITSKNYIANGKLVNQSLSYKPNSTYFYPDTVLSRKEVIGDNAMLLMEKPLLVPYQYWYLTTDNKLMNKYDNKCLTAPPLLTGTVYLDTCNTNTTNNLQQWTWDENNRIVNISSDGKNNCLTANTSSITLEACDDNNLKENEIWSFI